MFGLPLPNYINNLTLNMFLNFQKIILHIFYFFFFSVVIICYDYGFETFIINLVKSTIKYCYVNCKFRTLPNVTYFCELKKKIIYIESHVK